VTFGSLNTFRKTNPTLLSLWARLLQTLDAGGIRSRLLLVSPQGEHRTDLLAFFAAQSIAANRIELIAPMPYADYLATCHRIDIGLDTIPHNGATTTLDLLWMGVPVLGLHAAPPAPATSRLGTSILSTTGLTDWLAMSPDEYVQKALRFAQDLPYLMALRAGLREKLAASPLLDAKRFASHIELAYHTTWHAKLPQALRQPQA
jgi:predicted O-linked N-acetylglucosamine transferase (SPINDLY family)